MRIFADSADFAQMQMLADQVSGYTTNPTLMKAAGVTDYEYFARSCVERFPGHSLSFEVIADDLLTIENQARKIASWGRNVFVKVPAMTTAGNTTSQLVNRLSADGIKINVTAIFTVKQVDYFARALQFASDAYLSIFAGRIANTSRDPSEVISYAASIVTPNVQILWASTREVFNIRQARMAHADIITVTPDLLKTYREQYNKDLTQYSLETVEMFKRDAELAGLTL